MSVARQTYVSAVLDSGFEIGRHQIPREFVMLERSGKVDSQSFVLNESATGASLAQKVQSLEKITFNELGTDSLISAYQKAGRNQQRAIISLHLPNALYPGAHTAKFVRNRSAYGDKIHIFELLTTSSTAALQIIGFVDKAMKHNWLPLPIIKVVDYLRKRMRTVYVVPSDSPLFTQSNLLKRLTVQRSFVTFTIDLNGNIQILERGSAEKLIQHAPQWLQKITRTNNLNEGITQTSSHSLEAFQNHTPHSTSKWSPLIIGGVGNSYLEMSWRPSQETIKKMVKRASELYGQAVTYSKPLYEYNVKL